MKKFTLNPRGNDEYAKASRKALLVYATHINHCDPALAKEIYDWVSAETPVELGTIARELVIDFSEPSPTIPNNVSYSYAKESPELEIQWKTYTSWMNEPNTD